MAMIGWQGSGSIQVAVSAGRLRGMGAAAAPDTCPSDTRALNFLGYLISQNLFLKSSWQSIEPLRGVGVSVAPDGKPAGLPIPITSALAFRTMATVGSLPDCGSTVDGFEVICGKQPPAGQILVDIFYIGWTSPPAGVSTLPFLNLDRDGQPGNNIKPTAQVPYSTTIGGDGLLQVITDAKGRHIELVDEVTGKLKPISAIQLSGDNAAGWIIFDPSPAALYLPGVYDYRGSDSTAPNVGFDVASPASGPADPSKLDLAGLFFVPPVVQGP